MNPRQPTPVISKPPRPGFWSRWSPVILIVWATSAIPLYFFLFLTAGGINFEIDASKAALRFSILILPIPVLVSLAFAVQYGWRRWRFKGAGTPPPTNLIVSVAIVLFWVCALGLQSHRDAVFQRNLEARLQPWAESILARPRKEVVGRGKGTVRDDLISKFIGPSRHILIQDVPESRFGANEQSIVVLYGGHMTPIHGYVVGRKTLRIEGGERRAHKLRDGLYRFHDDY